MSTESITADPPSGQNTLIDAHAGEPANSAGRTNQRWPGRIRVGGVAGVLAGIAVLVAGCQSPTATSTQPKSTAKVDAAGEAVSGVGVVVTGRGWTAAGLQGPVPSPGSCHLRSAADGEPLPDPGCAPGAVDRAVTAADVGTTICRKSGYTSSVRPPESITEPAKKQIMAAYGIPWSQASKYELDHLVELNSGGSSDYRNLWPEPNTFRTAAPSAFIHNDKDAVEAYTFHAICARKVLFVAVQNDMAANWTTAVHELGLPPIVAGYRG